MKRSWYLQLAAREVCRVSGNAVLRLDKDSLRLPTIVKKCHFLLCVMFIDSMAVALSSELSSLAQRSQM